MGYITCYRKLKLRDVETPIIFTTFA